MELRFNVGERSTIQIKSIVHLFDLAQRVFKKVNYFSDFKTFP